MSRLWAFMRRMVMLRSESEALVRRTDKLVQRQRMLTEETGNFLVDRYRGITPQPNSERRPL